MSKLERALSDAVTAYDTITKAKGKFGVFHKSIFHIHTPASYDCILIDAFEDHQEKYKFCNDTYVYDLCMKHHVFINVPIETFDAERFSIYKDRKECLSYLLYASEIINNNIAIAVVTDHNTIEGYDKLTAAVKEIGNFRKGTIYPEIILGIEISCADRNHVVGIFDDKQEEIRGKLNKWLKDFLLSEKDGTYLTSIEQN